MGIMDFARKLFGGKREAGKTAGEDPSQGQTAAAERMQTDEELLDAFPEFEGHFTKAEMAGVLKKAMAESKSYREVGAFIWRECEKLYPMPPGSCRKGKPDYNPELEEWYNYFHGRYDEKYKLVWNGFNEWLDKVSGVFLGRNGVRRTYAEACSVAADEWCRMIFGTHVQDNGDASLTGGMTMALGTIVAGKHKDGIGKETVEKARELIREYYENGCVYEYESCCGGKTSTRMDLYCDYSPNVPLFGLLTKAGVPKGSADCICPWKTGIEIDDKDNSVVVRGYQKETII